MKATQITKLCAMLIAVTFAFTSCEEDETLRGPKNLPDAAVENMGKPVDKDKGAPAPGDKTILEVATAADLDGDGQSDFTILAAAVGAADPIVLETLSNEDQYTVFAPTDAAFVRLLGVLELTQEELLAETELLTTVLLYHVAEGRRAANSVVPPMKPRTIETLLEDATFSVNKKAMIKAVGSEANIIAPNISASNGIIHVIDEVLLPL